MPFEGVIEVVDFTMKEVLVLLKLLYGAVEFGILLPLKLNVDSKVV